MREQQKSNKRGSGPVFCAGLSKLQHVARSLRIDFAGGLYLLTSQLESEPHRSTKGKRKKQDPCACARVTLALAKPLAYYAMRRAERDQAIAEAYRTGAYSMQAIAEYFGVGRMTVSRAVKAISVKKHTIALVFSPAFGVAATVT